MPNLNKVFLMGHLTRDPELMFTPSNVGVVNFTVAVNSNIGKDADGNSRSETLFIDVVGFGKQAETIGNYFKKGSPIFIEGRLRTRTWQDKEGNKRSKMEVVLDGFEFLSPAPSKPDTNDANESDSDKNTNGDGKDNKSKNNVKDNPEFDDDIPF